MRCDVGPQLLPLTKRLGDASYGIYVLHAPATAIAFGLLAFIAPVDRWAPWSFLLIALALFGIVLWLDRYVDGPIRRRLSAHHAGHAPQVA